MKNIFFIFTTFRTRKCIYWLATALSYDRRLPRMTNAFTPPERLRIVEVHDEISVSRALKDLISITKNDLKVFGLDCEWDLVTQKGVIHKPDILQIATVQGFCALIRLHLLKKIPPDLKGFLEDPYFAKVGVGVTEDRDKLHQCYGVYTEGVVDVRHIADDLHIPPRGLSHLAKSVLGVELDKHHYTFHKWTGRLSPRQRIYAALDGVYSARVFYKMSNDRLMQVYGDEWHQWSHEEYHERTLAMWDKYFQKPFEFAKCKFYKNKIIDYMLSLSDLKPELGDEQGDRLEELEISEQPKPEELQEFPTFAARFSKSKKKKEKQKTVPKRFVKKFIRQAQEKGIDPKDIPVEVFPRSVLDESGKLDLSKI